MTKSQSVGAWGEAGRGGAPGAVGSGEHAAMGTFALDYAGAVPLYTCQDRASPTLVTWS